MNNSSENQQVPPPALVRRYTILFFLSTLLGCIFVFFAVAGRRYQLMEQQRLKKEAEKSLENIESSPGLPEKFPAN